MMGLATLVLAINSLPASGQAVCPPLIQWQKSFGTLAAERARAVQQAPDGGHIIGGDAESWSTGGNKTSENFGLCDFWIVRTDADGNKLWDRSYGGSGDERFAALDQTVDGGFIFGGSTWLDSTGGVKTSTNYGNTDYWIVRTDAGGNILWDRTFGGAWHDYLGDVRQTTDGGFVLAGWSASETNEIKSAPPISGEDFWIVRLDANGQKLWDRSYGGFFNDQARHIRQTADGGFLIGGYSEHGGFGMLDFRVMRIDANGNLLWDKHFGGVARDALLGMTLTADGGALLGGWSESGRSGNKTAALYGSSDFWVVGIDWQGNKLWDRSYGGTSHDILETLSAASDGGFLLAGYSFSPPGGTKTAPLINSAGYDFWVIRTDAGGIELWQDTFGGANSEACNATAQTTDGGFILVGTSASTDGDRRGTGFGSDDYWLVKLTAENPDDCDHDGVPDTHDQCASTPLGALVNADGCTIAQLCPCEMASHKEYLVCVREHARAFQRAGLINNVRRRQLIENARAANCPPSTGSGDKFIFGLPHRAINYATLDFLPVWFNGLVVTPEEDNPGPWGVSVAVGQADSGLFIYPDGGYSSYGDEWFLEATAAGRRAGDDRDDVVSRLRVRKPYYETYPVSVDLSALRPESVTTQILSNNTVISESTQLGSAYELTIYGSAQLDPRGNPFWRAPDGSVGALVEFTGPFVFGDNYFSIGGGEGDEALRGDKIFFRANRPRHSVEYVSRIDAVAGGGASSFEIVNERLGMFRHAHQALGAVVFEASARGLRLRTLEDLGAEDYTAVLVEAPTAASRLEIDFEPMRLEEPGAALTLYSAGALDEDDIMFSVLGLKRETNGLAFRCDYQVLFESTASNNPSVRIEAFRNGRITGSAVISGASVGGAFALIDGRAPAITGFRAIINSNAVPTLGISFGRVTTLDIGDDVQLAGNHFRVTPIDPARLVDSISAVTVEFVEQQSITIIGERSTAAPPTILIVGGGGELSLSWADSMHLYTLEAADSLSGPFTPITDEVETTNGQHRLTVPISSHGTRFYRLTGPAD